MKLAALMCVVLLGGCTSVVVSERQDYRLYPHPFQVITVTAYKDIAL